MASNHNHGRDQNIAQTINVQNGPVESVLEKLSKYAAFSALHNSEARGPRTGVHEGTREEFIENLGEWIEDPVESGRAYWARGGAGVGKSAVAQTICEKYAGGRLAGSYYFSRNDNSRNTINHFIPTIAYQLAKSHGVHSQLASKINDVLTTDPSIMDTDLEEQFKRLICAPCAAVDIELWSNLPRLIVIDGLDECMDRDPQTSDIDRKPGKRDGQRRLLSIIRNATSMQPCLPLHFLIFSRPEHTIFTSFRSHTFIPPLEEFDMRELRAQADADIKKYLRHEFAQFPDRHPDACLEEFWPGDKAIEELTLNADGHFVYVVTAVKYIAGDDPILLLPQDRLDVVLRTSQTSLYPDLTPLDQLFQHVLQPFMGLREQILLPILQLIISPHRDVQGIPAIQFDNGPRCRSRNAIAKLLKLDFRQVSAVLSRLQSILHVPDDDHHEDVSVLHASFSDFLIDKHRSLHFHVEPLRDRIYFGMLSQCLLPILNNITRGYAAGERMLLRITTFELYSIYIWNFVGYIFLKELPEGIPLENFIPNQELLHAINEFNVYHYMNMMVDWEYMCHIFTLFGNPTSSFVYMGVRTGILYRSMVCLRKLYLQCTECNQLTSGPLSPCTSRFRSHLRPFIENHKQLFEDGWLTMLPKICTAGTLSQVALLTLLVCIPLSSSPRGGFDQCLKLLALPPDTEKSELDVSFKSFPGNTNLAEVPEGSTVWYISCERGRTWADGMRRLTYNLGDDLYSEAARERGILSLTKGQFVGLDSWNDEIFMLLDLFPSLEGYGRFSVWDGVPFSDRASNHYPDWHFADEDEVLSEPSIQDTKLEDPEDILDYGREFPWRLKTPCRERLDSNQLKSAADPWQTDDDGRPELNVVWGGGVPIGKDGPGHEKDEETTPQFSGEVPMKDSENERGSSTRSEGEDLPQNEPCGLPEASETSLCQDEQDAGDTLVEAGEAAGILGLSNILNDLQWWPIGS
ncbi:hypothetical protein V5O48_016872 [Marasmius crinis-equi]|uniref:Nephrocystin 3-like N-terminal domain-containing protein n=1 Tax=Marasmius crinis-equi TaxID=585013 RepID=A0ABR3EQQ0_9AGAR